MSYALGLGSVARAEQEPAFHKGARVIDRAFTKARTEMETAGRCRLMIDVVRWKTKNRAPTYGDRILSRSNKYSEDRATIGTGSTITNTCQYGFS